MKIILFGAGKRSEKVIEEMTMMSCFEEEDIVAIADNNAKLWGTLQGEIAVVAPKEIPNYAFDKIVITTQQYENQIRCQLLEEVGIDADVIIEYALFRKQQFCRSLYQKQYGAQIRRKGNCFEDKKTVVYTCITGNYDELKEPQVCTDDLTYVCFTDNRDIKSSVWNIEYISQQDLDRVRLARQIKTCPHVLFPEYDVSIWVDGKFKIKDDLRSYIAYYGGQKPILCFPHYERTCIYEEAARCITLGKGKKKQIIGQITNYYVKGYPFDNGLYESGCMVRKHHEDIVKKIMTEWWGEIKTQSVRDQLSLPYIFRNNGFLPDICDLYIEDNRWLQFLGHLK